MPVEQVLDGVHGVLVTHTHRDHWDDAAIQLVPKDLPLFCQPEDLPKMESTHFVNAAAVHEAQQLEQDLHHTHRRTARHRRHWQSHGAR